MVNSFYISRHSLSQSQQHKILNFTLMFQLSIERNFFHPNQTPNFHKNRLKKCIENYQPQKKNGLNNLNVTKR